MCVLSWMLVHGMSLSILEAKSLLQSSYKNNMGHKIQSSYKIWDIRYIRKPHKIHKKKPRPLTSTAYFSLVNKNLLFI